MIRTEELKATVSVCTSCKVVSLSTTDVNVNWKPMKKKKAKKERKSEKSEKKTRTSRKDKEKRLKQQKKTERKRNEKKRRKEQKNKRKQRKEKRKKGKKQEVKEKTLENIQHEPRMQSSRPRRAEKQGTKPAHNFRAKRKQPLVEQSMQAQWRDGNTKRTTQKYIENCKKTSAI